jgi:hypothetical protein
VSAGAGCDSQEARVAPGTHGSWHEWLLARMAPGTQGHQRPTGKGRPRAAGEEGKGRRLRRTWAPAVGPQGSPCCWTTGEPLPFAAYRTPLCDCNKAKPRQNLLPPPHAPAGSVCSAWACCPRWRPRPRRASCAPLCALCLTAYAWSARSRSAGCRPPLGLTWSPCCGDSSGTPALRRCSWAGGHVTSRNGGAPGAVHRGDHIGVGAGVQIRREMHQSKQYARPMPVTRHHLPPRTSQRARAGATVRTAAPRSSVAHRAAAGGSRRCGTRARERNRCSCQRARAARACRNGAAAGGAPGGGCRRRPVRCRCAVAGV